MRPENFRPCPECDSVSRRDFLKWAGGAALVASVPGAVPSFAGEEKVSPVDNKVAELYRSLTADQKKVLCFPVDHQLRTVAKANWNITEPHINDLEVKQQDIVEAIFRGLCSEDGYGRFEKQMGDDYGGMGSYHIAFFGEPGDKRFEFVMTGRHMTMRADGNKDDGVAFGGPMVYGHAASGFDEKATHPDNVFWFQAQRANEVFKALDGKQREQALLGKAPPESQIKFRPNGYPGLGVGEMSSDQKALVEKVMADLLSPYRKQDVDEALSVIKSNGGLDKIHLSFYREGADGKSADVGSDGVWDVWRLEGPGLVWHFRGAPHVHTWVNIAKV